MPLSRPKLKGKIRIAADLFVRARRRCRAATSSSLLDLDSQDPFVNDRSEETHQPADRLNRRYWGRRNNPT